MNQQTKMYEGTWKFLREQSIVVPINTEDGQLPVQMWYFSKNCFSAESYWTALSQDPYFMAWESGIEYDIDQWKSQLCSSWTLCDN